MKTLTLANQKGGVGKSANHTQLAYYFNEQNLKVLVIDLDHQANTSKAITKSGLATVSKINSYALLADKIDKIEKDNFVLIPSSPDLIKVEKKSELMDNNKKYANTFVNNFDQFLKTIQKDFDICLIDTNPNPDIRLTIALATSNYVLSPIQLNQEALDGIAALKRDIHTIQTVNKNLKFIGILPNLVEPTPFQKDNFVELVTRYKEMMISLNNDTVASIAKRSIIAEAQAAAMPFWKMPKSTARTTWNEIKPIFDFIKETMGV